VPASSTHALGSRGASPSLSDPLASVDLLPRSGNWAPGPAPIIASRTIADRRYFERTRGCAPPAGQILGTARSDQHGAALARLGEAGGGTRASRSGIRLVHRRFRYARSEGGEGAAGGASGLIAPRHSSGMPALRRPSITRSQAARTRGSALAGGESVADRRAVSRRALCAHRAPSSGCWPS
jgi:hypothetical protein